MLAGGTGSPPGTVGPTTRGTPPPGTPGAVPGTTAFDGVTLTYDGQPATVAHTLIKQSQEAGGGKSTVYLIGYGDRNAIANGAWALSLTTGVSAGSQSVGVNLSNRLSEAATNIAVYSATMLTSGSGTPFVSPPSVTMTSTAANGKRDLHMAGTIKSVIGGSGEHTFDLTLTGLPE
jgi:hypothetical protein